MEIQKPIKTMSEQTQIPQGQQNKGQQTQRQQQQEVDGVEDYAEYYDDIYDDYGTVYDIKDEKGYLQLSVEHTQHQFEELLLQIYGYVQKIQQKTKLHFDLLLYCYYELKWDKDWFQEFIQKTEDLDNTQYEIKEIQQLFCMNCWSDGVKLIQNSCGHQFCLGCWGRKFHQNIEDDPFPMCLSCSVKMSFSLCMRITQSNKESEIVFKKSLCKNFLKMKPDFKICIGRSNKVCTKYFHIKDKLKMIECTNCGSFLCPQCGQQAHGHIHCKDVSLWRQQIRNKQIPPRFKSFEQKYQYSEIEAISANIQLVSDIKLNLSATLKYILKNYRFYDSQLSFLKELIDFTQKGLIFIWGESILIYFNKNQKREFLLSEIKAHIHLIIQFLEVLPSPELELFVCHKLFTWKKMSLPESQGTSSKEIKEAHFLSSFVELSKNLKQISKNLNQQIENLINEDKD